VYDNDNKKNNPSIFVLENLNKAVTEFNHDDDFAHDMVQRVVNALGTTDPRQRKDFRCTADIRNTGKNTMVLVKFLHRILHVYIDTLDGHGYKYCLAVPFETTFLDYHIAFTAATGQVADEHDILEITTRYLNQSDRSTDDSRMESFGFGDVTTVVGALVFFLYVILLALVAASGYFLYIFKFASTDEVLRLKPLNKFLLPHLYLHLLLICLLILNRCWILFIFHFALLGWKMWSWSANHYVFTASQFRGRGFGINKLLPTTPRLILDLTIYVLSLFFFHFF